MFAICKGYSHKTPCDFAQIVTPKRWIGFKITTQRVCFSFPKHFKGPALPEALKDPKQCFFGES